MRHKGWKIAFGVSWIPAVLGYWLCIEVLLDLVNQRLFSPVSGWAIFMGVLPLVGIVATQAVLGYFAFRR